MQIVMETEAKEIIAKKYIVFVHFCTLWCDLCKEYIIRVEKDVMFLLASRPDVSFIHVDVENREAYHWADELGMVSVPTTIVFMQGVQINVDYWSNGGMWRTGQKIIRGNLLMIKELVKRILDQFPPQ